MLELCATACLVMSDSKQYKQAESGSSEGVRDHLKLKTYRALGSGAWNHDSSEDPAICSTQAAKSVSSNARTHPQASHHSKHSSSSDTPDKDRDSHMTRHASNHVYNHASNKGSEGKSCDSASTNGKRRRSKEPDDHEDTWTEHTSSSGRTYYYNKRLDKSQWERPKGMLKRAKGDVTGKHATPASKSSHHHEAHTSGHAHREGGMSHGHREGSSGHGYKEREGGRSSRGGSGTTRSRDHRDKTSGHASSQGDKRGESRHHARKSRSHSGSSSPPHSTKHSGKSASRVATPSGRGHSNSIDSQHAHTVAVERIAGSPSSTPKGSGIQLISPTTPNMGVGSGGGHTPSFPTSLSHSLNATTHAQQVLDHTSLLLATPTLTNQVYSTGVVLPGTTPTHQMQPLAKKKLSLTPQQPQQHHVLSPSYSNSPQTTPTPAQMVMGRSVYQGGVVASPQSAGVDGTGLHPLQRALLLQNQKVQQMPHLQGVEPQSAPPMATPTAIPLHMTSLQSHHSESPPQPVVVQSPGNLPPPQVLPTGLSPYPAHTLQQPLTPHQPNVFGMAPTTFDLSGPPPPQAAGHTHHQAYVLSSKVLQTAMSKLSYLNPTSPELCQFPDAGSLEGAGSVSQVSAELVDRDLATLWTQHSELLAKQVEKGQLDTSKRRTVDSIYLSGQVTKRQLALAAGQVKTLSRNQQLRLLQALVQELDKR